MFAQCINYKQISTAFVLCINFIYIVNCFNFVLIVTVKKGEKNSSCDCEDV